MKFINENKRVLISTYVMLIFFIAFPFIDSLRQLSYISFEVIAIMYFGSFIAMRSYKDIFFRYYSLVVLWCVVVTALSFNIQRSFMPLRFWVIPLIMYVALSQIDIKQIFNKYIWIPTLLLLIENIILFIWWSHFSYLFNEFSFLSTAMIFIGDWYVKIYTSTVVLCMLIGIFFTMPKSPQKNILIIINLISAFLSYDRAFWFGLLLVAIMYIFLEKVKLSLKSIIYIVILSIVSIVILAFLMHYMGMDLHYKERFATYQYWLSVIHVSPLYGVGVGRDSLVYYIQNYPVPEAILRANPFTTATSHNFFLDLLLTQGVIGLCIFLLLLYKINVDAITNFINPQYRFLTLYFTIAVFSKFLVDNQFDNRKIVTFWFFIIMGYVLSRGKYAKH